MLSLPDFKEKQIITIQIDPQTPANFKFSNDNLVFYKENKITNKISLYKVFAIFIIGSFTISSNLIEKCLSYGISIFLLKYNLETYCEIEAFARGNYLLRYQQYHLDSEQELQIAKQIIINKVDNQLKEIKSTIGFDKYKQVKSKAKKDIYKATDYKILLGIEGNIAKTYFEVLYKDYSWYGRRPRAKPDINNFLMDIGYTYLFNFVDSLLRLYGFDTYKGIYHKLFFQRKSLSCDIMEPFRPIIDRAIIKAWNLKQIDAKDFDYSKPNLQLPWKNSKKYSQFLLESIMDNKIEIYNYIKMYYRHIMNPTDNQLPYFKTKTR